MKFSPRKTILYYVNVKKLHLFRVTWPYINLLVKPSIFSGFLEKYNFKHFEMRNAFQNA